MNAAAKNFLKTFNQINGRGDWQALASTSPEKYGKMRKQVYDSLNSKARDIMNRGRRAAIANEDSMQVYEATYTSFADNRKPMAIRNRYTTDDYLRPVDGEKTALNNAYLNEVLRERGISLRPYGNAQHVTVGNTVKVCLPMHLLSNKTGEVVGQRRSEYLVRVGNVLVWLSASEMEVV